jgi:hypothetical protein
LGKYKFWETGPVSGEGKGSLGSIQILGNWACFRRGEGVTWVNTNFGKLGLFQAIGRGPLGPFKKSTGCRVIEVSWDPTKQVSPSPLLKI